MGSLRPDGRRADAWRRRTVEILDEEMIVTPRMVWYFGVMRWGAFLTVLLVLFVGTFGVWHALNMHGEMSGCPLMTYAASLCGMSPIEHLAVWQRVFTAVPQRALMLLLGFLMFGIVLSRLGGSRVRLWADQAQYQATRRLVLVFAPLEPLKRAFSQGILHPKIY